jgi:hypothetical protein
MAQSLHLLGHTITAAMLSDSKMDMWNLVCVFVLVVILKHADGAELGGVMYNRFKI